MASNIEGKVKKSTVNHYKDCGVDTDIELEDGTQIVYSHAAPIPKGHNISSIGVQMSMAEVMSELHPNYFRLVNRELQYVLPPATVGINEFINPNAMVLRANEITDENDDVTYRERY